MKQQKTYAGLHNDANGGMTSIGKIIVDAWVFELLPETESCEGWTMSRIEALLQQVNSEWDKYGCMVSELPPEIRERHKRLYDEAIARANKAGWNGDTETDLEG